MLAAMRPKQRGVTLIESIVVLAIMAAVVAFATPSFIDMMITQRMRGMDAQLTTDLQFARSQALALNTQVRVIAGSNTSLSCYAVIATDTPSLCDCTKTPGSICSGSAVEIRTVQVDQSSSVSIGSIAPATSSLVFYPVDGSTNPYKGDAAVTPTPIVFSISIDGGTGSRKKRLTTTIQTTGRPSVCYDSSYATISGFPVCPKS